MKKKSILLFGFIFASLSAAQTAFAENADYIPLRKMFEGMGYTVSWNSETPDKAFVNIGDDFQITFQDNSSNITVCEGEFTLDKATYIQDGTTYISPDSVELCDNLYLYHNAIKDASNAQSDELMPLKAIDTNADSALVCTWNKYPDSYVTGSNITISYGDVWVFTQDEIYSWGQKNGMADNMTLRIEQLIGLPPQKGYTHFSVLRVNPSDLFRPSRDCEINDTQAELEFPYDVTPEHKHWFESNAEYSYNPHRYPWTGLGYTYDWADNGTEYGLSEFILRDGAKAKVEKTYTNEEFYQYITEPHSDNQSM